MEITSATLYEVCDEVTDLNQARSDVEAMWEVLHRYPNGVGLAANQVGLKSRIILINTTNFIKPMINPVIVKKSTQMMISEEGCLSFDEGKPTTQIERHKQITVQWQNLKGGVKTQKFRGFEGRVIQHEVDHLDGITIF